MFSKLVAALCWLTNKDPSFEVEVMTSNGLGIYIYIHIHVIYIYSLSITIEDGLFTLSQSHVVDVIVSCKL